MTDHPIRDLVVAIGYVAVGAIKGTRLFWDAIDDLTAKFVAYADLLDPGCEHEACCPDYAPDGLAGDR